MKHLIASLIQIIIVTLLSLGLYEISAPSLQKITGLNFAMIEEIEVFFFGSGYGVSFFGDKFEIDIPYDMILGADFQCSGNWLISRQLSPDGWCMVNYETGKKYYFANEQEFEAFAEKQGVQLKLEKAEDIYYRYRPTILRYIYLIPILVVFYFFVRRLWAILKNGESGTEPQKNVVS